MSETNRLIVWRESVCQADDCDAPHERVFSVSTSSLCSITDRLLEARYLAPIYGGRATWILQSNHCTGRALAVLAPQWSQPRFLVDPDKDVFSYVQLDANQHLYLSYWCQADPDQVFECLQRGEILTDRCGRKISA